MRAATVGRWVLPASIGYWQEVCELSMFSIVPEESGKGGADEVAKAAEPATASEKEAAKGVAPIEEVRPVVPEGGLGAQVEIGRAHV